MGPLDQELRRYNTLKSEAARLRQEEQRFERLADQQHQKIERMAVNLDVAVERQVKAAAARDLAAESASNNRRFAQEQRQRQLELQDKLKVEPDSARAKDLRDDLHAAEQLAASYERRAATFDQRLQTAQREVDRANTQLDKASQEQAKAVDEKKRLLGLAEERETAAEKVEAEMEKIAPLADAGDQGAGSTEAVAVAATATGTAAALLADDDPADDDPAALDDPVADASDASADPTRLDDVEDADVTAVARAASAPLTDDDGLSILADPSPVDVEAPLQPADAGLAALSDIGDTSPETPSTEGGGLETTFAEPEQQIAAADPQAVDEATDAPAADMVDVAEG